MPSHPKRHHYLPESYLKRFKREKALWVYDIETKQLRPQTPTDTGAIGYFNVLEDTNGVRQTNLNICHGAIRNRRVARQSLLRELDHYGRSRCRPNQKAECK